MTTIPQPRNAFEDARLFVIGRGEATEAIEPEACPDCGSALVVHGDCLDCVAPLALARDDHRHGTF